MCNSQTVFSNFVLYNINNQNHCKQKDTYSSNVLYELALATIMHPTQFLMYKGANADAGFSPPAISQS